MNISTSRSVTISYPGTVREPAGAHSVENAPVEPADQYTPSGTTVEEAGFWRNAAGLAAGGAVFAASLATPIAGAVALGEAGLLLSLPLFTVVGTMGSILTCSAVSGVPVHSQ